MPRLAGALLCLLSGTVSAAQTYLALADCDDAALGPSGDIYLACHSPDDRLPIQVKPARPERDVMDAYVLRLSPQGKLIYATRIAGSDYDNAVRIRIDGRGFAYAAGFTKSRDFPVTPHAFQPRYAGGDSDAFLVKLTPSGSVVYASYLGGSGTDQGNGLAMDRHSVCMGGTTWSNDLPGAVGTAKALRGDAFLTCFETDLSRIRRSVVFGGSEEEKLTGIEVDGRGGIMATGYTKSADFPVKNPIQATLNGASDAFLARFRIPELTSTLSTFFGASGDDSGWGISAGRDGAPVIAGITASGDMPAHASAYQRSKRGGTDVFVAKLSGAGFREIRLTYFGGSVNDESGYDGGSIKVDDSGNIWVAGITASLDLPVRSGSQPTYAGGDTDGFLAAFSPDLSQLCYATYQGGAGRDLLEGLAIRKKQIVATGLTFSTDLAGVTSAITVAGRPVNAMLLILPAQIAKCKGF